MKVGVSDQIFPADFVLSPRRMRTRSRKTTDEASDDQVVFFGNGGRSYPLTILSCRSRRRNEILLDIWHNLPEVKKRDAQVVS